MTRFLYTLAIHALLPWAVLHLLWRARRQKNYLHHWGERFGQFGKKARPRTPGPLIWIHAVSVGETRAAQPLVAALRARYPEHRILITHMTPTGRATSKALFGKLGTGVERVYLPYDTPWAVGAFLHHFKPALGLIMETELWPNLVAACRDTDIPLLLVNARLSEKSAARYARFPLLARTALRQLSAIAAIGGDDARRLRQLGAPDVAVFGNLKFDIEPPIEQLQIGATFRARIGKRPVFLCASTREGEEALILDAALKVSLCETALLVIVPRHPQRFDEVARLVESRGLKLQRRSDGQPIAADTQVWLGDSMGELFAYYAAAGVNGVTFVGGSLLDFGSQNLIEPCTVGVPVLIGPSTFNFADAAQNALAIGAVRQYPDAEALVNAALALLNDTAARAAISQAGREFTAAHRGATEKTLALVDSFIPAAR